MRSGARGYTAVEVLSAMTLFAIGAAGVIGMQKVTIQGGEDARRFDIANNIASEWLNRLQRDSMRWTKPNPYDPVNSNLDTETAWIKDVATAGCNGTYCNPTIPAATPEGISPAFDIFGRDQASGTGEHVYCVQYMLNWIAPPGTAPNFNPMALMRADVRVFWARLDRAPIGNCAAPPVNPDSAAAVGAYHFVYASTAIRENTLR